MKTTWQDVVEMGRTLPFKERVAAARELLMPSATYDEELTEEERAELQQRLGEKHLYEPYRMGGGYSSASA
jgi:hypothetical protein